ncbi:amidohydrolase [Schizopora paradoxa]|uniref:Amidohydrolase n=1 Tax=Schizopora paradoxa TaxID=27342 RepID=A0A0H2RRM1_9AGAM|nr:amidohydrolase [Schizopora paradoxa]
MSGDSPQIGCFTPFRRLRFGNGGPRRSSPSRQDTPRHEVDDKATADDLQLRMEAHCIPCDFGVAGCSKGDSAKAFDDAPPSYSLEETSDARRYEQTVEETIARWDPDLRELSLQIHEHPELGFQEFYAHDTLTSFMSKHGFTVTPHLCGLKTAWRAEYSFGKGGRVFGINAEMDALPHIGHGCGHNLIAMSAVGVALAAKAVLETHRIPGTIVLLGTPAEEGGGGKIVLLERGAYQGMDFCLMCHPGPGPSNSSGTGSSLATQSVIVEYFGHSAHAAAAPWEGKNALDAAVLAYSSVAALRQQIKPNCRVHGTIEGNNWEPNVIPDYAKMRWIVRAPSYTELTDLLQRVRRCIEAAGTATECRVEVSLGLAYHDLSQNSALAREFGRVVTTRYGMATNNDDAQMAASTDFGNVTYELPGLHPAYSIPTVPHGANHTAEFTKSARSIEAHKTTLKIVVGLTLTGLRVLDDDTFYDEVKRSFHRREYGNASP